ncbi:MAG TPA: hypothetical protein VFJ16_03570 [Longimicrobium sp.]|nr:hypothetical protein [Longimicrobium sp.]
MREVKRRAPARWAAVVAVSLLAACASAGSGGSTRLPVARARLGEDFRLAPKQIAVIQGEPLTVRFASVVSDSRCPAGVQCVRAGEARLEISIQQAGLEPAVDTLATAPPLPGQASVGAYEVTLVGLAPELRQGTPAPAYIATLRVTRR